MPTNHISGNKVNLIDDVTYAANTTNFSVWYPIDGWTPLSLWKEVDPGGGSVEHTIILRLSDEHYQVLRDAETVVGDLTNERFIQVIICTAATEKVKTLYTDIDFPLLSRPFNSVQVYLYNAAGADTADFTVTLGSFG